ncbi:MAG TPA: DUF3857 domain-containing protein [Vicinamibacterales bacterium]|nr:DUF3857 domain-containing protein [Vicinamibacterales bacterium]
MRFGPRLAAFMVWLLFVATSSLGAQTSSSDYSKEPVVVERSFARIVVDADGTQTRDVEVRVRVQSAAGLQAVGTLVIPYSRAVSTIDVRYIRSHKPDGTTVETPASAAIDVAADLTRQAPTFADVYLKEFNVKGLAVGDTLEYALQIRSKSMLPPHFFIDEDWTEGAIVLAQDLEIAFPASVNAKVKTLSGADPTVEVRQGVRTYRWHRAELTRPSEKDLAVRSYERQLRPADVRVTSFGSWEELGAAVRDLWRDRAAVTPAIRDKAAELTRGMTTNREKIAALYAFVSTKIRYVAVSFGIGRIQPHAASDVLDNGFGDCKDKHTLLTALLAAVGITAEPALITPGVPLDQDVPTLSQFNHVITSVTTNGAETWMDTTLEVAPVGLLIGPERDQDTLLVDSRGPARVVRTPATPVRESSWHVDVVGTLSGTGSLDATVHEVVSGDLEVGMRAVLRGIPQTQWQAAAKQLPLTSRFGGTVSDLEISPLEDVATPLKISYRYTVDSYSDWAKGEVTAPVPLLNFPNVPAADAPPVPVDLPGASDFVFTSRLTLPEGVVATLGTDDKAHLVVDEPFARYQLDNTLNGRVFETRRAMLWKKKNLAPSEFDAYRAFITDFTSADYVVNIEPIVWRWSDRPNIDWYGGEAEATVTVLKDAADAEKQGNHQHAQMMLQDLTRTHPTSDKAWQMLAWTQYNSGRRDEAIAALRQRIATSPSLDSYKLLATWLHGTDQAEVWRAAWQKYGKDDGRLALFYAESLLAAREYHEAAGVLQAQAGPQAQSSRYQYAMGMALVGDGRQDEGVTALKRSAELDSSPLVMNNVAYQLALSGLAKDDALALAVRAVNATEDRTKALTLAKVDAASLNLMVSLGAYWDTLAWAHFQLGHLEEAERDDLAAFDLMLDPDATSHLAAIYRAMARPDVAAFFDGLAETLLARDAAGWQKAMSAPPRSGASASPAIPPPMVVRIARRPEATGKADVYVLGGADGKISDAGFISGDASLKPQIADLRGQTLLSRFPTGSSALLVRRGTLTCSADARQCEFVLMPASNAAAAR